MTEQKPEKIKLVEGGDATLYRNFQLTCGQLAIVTGDRMVVQHITGQEEDVVVALECGTLRAKRLVLHVEMPTSTAAVRTSALVSGSVAEIDEDSERRLLEIYGRFRKAA